MDENDDQNFQNKAVKETRLYVFNPLQLAN